MEQLDAAGWAELIRKAQTGSRPDLELLLMRAQEVAYRFSVLVCGGVDEADDVMQAALIKTYRYVATIRKPAKFRAWLSRTVRNACLINRRKRVDEPASLMSVDQWGRIDGGDSGAMDPVCDPEARAIKSGLRTRLFRALQVLRRPYRVVVVFREIESLSTREVAEVLGISEVNVKTRLRRGHLMLRDAFGPLGDQSPPR
jgi:RNA polymerase sigma-70 factor (ECF subfamily)